MNCPFLTINPWASKVLGQALLAENQASAEGMRYLQAQPEMFTKPFLVS